jgi:hypothetical protein
MTWHVVKIPNRYERFDGSFIARRDFMWGCRDWCMNSLSSDGVLWKYDPSGAGIFYFAQPQDAVMFRLVHGV